MPSLHNSNGFMLSEGMSTMRTKQPCPRFKLWCPIPFPTNDGERESKESLHDDDVEGIGKKKSSKNKNKIR